MEQQIKISRKMYRRLKKGIQYSAKKNQDKCKKRQLVEKEQKSF